MNKKIAIFRGLSRREYGRNAILGLGFSAVLQMNNTNLFLDIISTGLGLLGLVYGVVWIYKIITKSK